MLPKGYLSVSQIRSYQRCPKQYQYKYLENIPETYGSSLLIGKAFHSAIETANRAKADTGYILPSEHIKDAYSTAWEGQKQGIEFESDEDQGKVKDRGLEMTVKYYEEVGQHNNPDYIEMDFDIQVSGVPLKGFIDLTEKDGTIRDYKTSGSSPSKYLADDSIQLTAYALAYRDLTGEKETKVGLDYVVNLKKEIKIVRLESKISDKRIERFEQTVSGVAKAIESGVFFANEESTACSWCSFRKICKG